MMEDMLPEALTIVSRYKAMAEEGQGVVAGQRHGGVVVFEEYGPGPSTSSDGPANRGTNSGTSPGPTSNKSPGTKSSSSRGLSTSINPITDPGSDSDTNNSTKCSTRNRPGAAAAAWQSHAAYNGTLEHDRAVVAAAAAAAWAAVSTHGLVSSSSTAEQVPIVLSVHIIFRRAHLKYSASNDSPFRFFVFALFW